MSVPDAVPGRSSFLLELRHAPMGQARENGVTAPARHASTPTRKPDQPTVIEAGQDLGSGQRTHAASCLQCKTSRGGQVR